MHIKTPLLSALGWSVCSTNPTENIQSNTALRPGWSDPSRLIRGLRVSVLSHLSEAVMRSNKPGNQEVACGQYRSWWHKKKALLCQCQHNEHLSQTVPHWVLCNMTLSLSRSLAGPDDCQGQSHINVHFKLLVQCNYKTADLFLEMCFLFFFYPDSQFK